ncbi:MAG TPA: hypothetical protein VGL72_24560, partial [Bryobacteraceae bacterium]
GYVILVTRRMHRQTSYKLVFEDWMFFVLLPLAAYGTLVGSAFAAWSHLHEALFGVAASLLLLLFIGIHNAWDAIIYHVFSRDRDNKTEKEQR